MPPFGANVPLPILQEGDKPAYVQLDHNEALIVDAPKDSQIIVNYVIIIRTLFTNCNLIYILCASLKLNN